MSGFHGREPDEHRYDIETGALDSTAVRLAWNPTANWSLQTSWADVKSPEQLDPRNANLLGQHAFSYIDLRRFAEANRKLDEVLDITPDDIDTIATKAAIAATVPG